jgi:hypothetical protein
MFKMFLFGAGVAVLLASSAMAQSYDPAVGSGNIAPNTNQSPTGPTVSEPSFGSEPYVGRPSARAYAPDSYAYQPAPRHHLHRNTMQGHSDMDRE